MQPDTEKILERCERLFMRLGIKSITMDDVARDLGISKKTLYQHFENKNDLVTRVTAYHFERANGAMQGICSHSENAIDELLNMSSWLAENMKGINPTLIYDLRRYYPEAWQNFQRHKVNDVYSCIHSNILRGMKEGLYRTDMNPEVIARFYIGKMEVVIDTELFPPGQFSFQDTHREFIHYHIRGLASAKGLEYLENKQNLTNVA
jgi:AcrR family transcriptional regulator